ncbi:MAG: TraR/DksA C4-type zinc finger protein [Verrucomicrobiota bacterium]
MTKKKTPAKKKSVKKVATKKGAAKTTAAKNTKKTAAKKNVKAAVTKAPAKKAAAVKKAAVTRALPTLDKKATPIVFSIDDIEALVASRKKEVESIEETAAPKKAALKKAPVAAVEEKPSEKRVHGAASLADILGFNPAEKKKDPSLDEDEVPKKWIKFYRLLIDLRNHVRDELDLHTADTLKHSSREDSGDLSGFGNHQADAATDTFDRDFALSLVSNEQDALNEIEEAINRIKNGTYGVCEVTGKPINKERLIAVPFARFSVEGQSEYEKNRRRKVDRAATGLFGDATETPAITSDDEE